jgi:hypothetical protein
MKTFTALAAVAALVGGMTVASAQNAPSPDKQSPSPSAINGGGTETGTKAGKTSGTARSDAMMKSDKKSASMKKRSTTGSGGVTPDPESRGSPLYGPDHTKLPSDKK